MKILISDSLEQSCIDILLHEQFEVDNRPGLPAEELKKVIGAYDGLIVRSATKVTTDVIGKGVRLKVIGRAGTGVDNIDVDAATRRGVLVMNTPGGNTVSAAEHTVSLMLSLVRNIPQASASLLRGEWERKKFTGMEVFEKTIGVIGLGKIGYEVAMRCMGLGMKVLGYDPVLSNDVMTKMKIEPVSLDELYRRADIITVHTPLTAQTRGLLNDDVFRKCKKGVRVINCARGGIIDEGALLRALESGQVGGAALDVFEVEPPKGNPLLAHPHVIATPHLGASTEEAQEKVAIQIARQVADALKERAFTAVVNGAAMHLTLKQEIRPFVKLAERLGSLAAQATGGRLRHVTFSAAGEAVTGSIELLKSSVLKGVLSHMTPDPVNFINASFLAKELGVTVTDQRGMAAGDFANFLSVRYETESETREVAGSVFGSSAIRLVQMDGFTFEVNPEGHLLIYKNIDKPGMLARVGTILAQHQVNIAGVSLGRTAMGETALTVMNVDSDVPTAALSALKEQEGVSDVKVVRLE
jgi:D-3-phosphoglycerate dehydrogenase / 2-oxoglutarate reductase